MFNNLFIIITLEWLSDLHDTTPDDTIPLPPLKPIPLFPESQNIKPSIQLPSVRDSVPKVRNSNNILF